MNNGGQQEHWKNGVGEDSRLVVKFVQFRVYNRGDQLTVVEQVANSAVVLRESLYE